MKTENQAQRIAKAVKSIQQGKLKSVYLISGEEDYFVHTAKKQISEAIKTVKQNAELILFEAEKSTVQSIKHRLLSPSLFNSFQIFIISDCDWADKKTREGFQAIIDRMIEGSMLSVLIVTSKSADKRLNIVKAIAKHGVHLDFPKVKTFGRYDTAGDPYYPLVRERLRARNQTIANDAWKLLRDLTREDAWSVINAVDVVSGYAGERARIEKRDVERCITDSSEFPGYLVVQLLGEKKPAQIKSSIEKTLMDGTPPLLLSKSLSNRVRFLLVVLMLDLHKIRLPDQFFVFRDVEYGPIMERIEAHPVAKEILGSQKPYVLYKLLQQAQQLLLSDLFTCFENLADIDRLIKSGSTAIHGLFELALMPLSYRRGDHT